MYKILYLLEFIKRRNGDWGFGIGDWG